ncbi:hypothetical protein [Cytobacillus firmus]|uniref:hypothetical protein n=1 Tax=Cytobacillus firmus TaxID=1399 RepID=UPI00216222AD|nr:hypothetical protein [Cytobacillus firmus]MCS0673484.1 hypothetical protein [Cytobacillus firmus]
MNYNQNKKIAQITPYTLIIGVCPNISFSVTILQLKPIYRQVNSYENLRNQE